MTRLSWLVKLKIQKFAATRTKIDMYNTCCQSRSKHVLEFNLISEVIKSINHCQKVTVSSDCTFLL